MFQPLLSCSVSSEAYELQRDSLTLTSGTDSLWLKKPAWDNWDSEREAIDWMLVEGDFGDDEELSDRQNSFNIDAVSRFSFSWRPPVDDEQE